MKKVVLSLAVLFSVALVSCSGNKSEQADSAAVDSAVLVEETITESIAIDSAAPADTTVVADSAK